LTTPKWIFALAIGLFSCAALADRVVLDNGDRLSGSIVSMMADALWLETAYAGKIKLPRARLVRIETNAAVRVRLSDGTELDGQLQAADPGQLSIHIGSLAQTLHLDGEMVARNPIQRITLGGDLNEASQDGEDTASNWRVGLKYDHFVRERTYLYANTRFDHDRQADLELRSTLGVGGGRQFYDRDDLRLALEGGLGLVNEDYRNAADLSFPGARLALKYQQALWQKS
jgi:small nuclear ribonucleoprotein (snRNP)-like protein